LGQPAKLVVDQRQKLIRRSSIPLLDGLEDTSDVIHED
jgi:hypothetical protein